MTVEQVPFDPDHLRGFVAYRAGEERTVEAAAREFHNEHLDMWTILSGDRVVCIWGILNQGPGRSEAWSVMGEHAGPCMRALLALTTQTLDARPEHRIQVDVEAGYEAGARFARLLGFTYEGTQRSYYAPGHDADIYVRLKS